MKNILTVLALMFCVLSVQAQNSRAEKKSIKKAAEVAEQVAEQVASEAATAEEDVEEEIDQVEGPGIYFSEEAHDFGKKAEGPKYDHTFTFINNGTQPLVLTNVKASCGCTTPMWPKAPVMPGAEAEIEVIYNSKGRVGKFNKVITISSNAADNPTKNIYIRGEILKSETATDEEEAAPVKEEK